MGKVEIKAISWEEAKKKTVNYKYSLLYYISQTVLDRTDKIPEINWNELKEAYFFGPGGQLHLFHNGIEMKAVEMTEGDASFVEKEYALNSNHKVIGKSIMIHEYLDSDEDGQTFVAYTQLVDIK